MERHFEIEGENANIENIFQELKARDIDAEGRGRKIIYKGKSLDFKITPHDASYEKKFEYLEEDLPALAFLKTEMRKYGFREKSASAADITYTDGEEIRVRKHKPDNKV